MSKREAADRRARVEEMRRAQAARERRQQLLVGGAAAVVVLALVVAVFVVIRNQVAAKDITKVGVPAAAASCDQPLLDRTSGSSVHVGPGTNQPNVTKVNYSTVPPSSGKHFATPQSPARPFYTASDRPALETLVHNLEHGYTLLWYDQKLPPAQIDQLKRIGDLARQDKATSGKFIVSAWDAGRGAFPAGRTVALSHWGTKNGYRQFCAKVSGQAVKAFVAAHPYSDSPEPNGA